MPTQDVDVGSLTQRKKFKSNREKLSELLDLVTPQDQLKDCVKGKIPKHFKRNTIREREGFEKELEYYKLGFTTALSELNIELWWSQAVQFGAFLSGKYKTGYCVATPRYGKSFLCGTMSVHFSYEGQNCYAVGSTQEYSGIIIQHAREILVKAHPEVKEMLTFDDGDISAVDKKLKRGLSSFSSEGFSFRNGGKLEGRVYQQVLTSQTLVRFTSLDVVVTCLEMKLQIFHLLHLVTWDVGSLKVMMVQN